MMPAGTHPVDGTGRLPLSDRLSHLTHSDMNPAKASAGPIPTAVRLPDRPLPVCVLGGDSPLGSALLLSLQNPHYSPAFLPSSVATSTLAPLTEANAATLLAPLLAGVHTVIQADSHPLTDPVTADAREAAVLSACKAAGVQRFLPSPFGVDAGRLKGIKGLPDAISRAAARQSALSLSGLTYTSISCGVLTELLFSPLCGVDLERGVVSAPGDADAQVTTTTLGDVARLLPEVLLSPAAKNKSVDLASAVVTYREVAAVLERVTGRPITLRVVDAGDLKAKAMGEGAGAGEVMDYLIAQGRALLWSKGDSWNAKHTPHVVTTTVEDWAVEHLGGGGGRGAGVGRGWQENLHPAAFSAPDGAAVRRPDTAASVFTGEQVPAMPGAELPRTTPVTLVPQPMAGAPIVIR